MAVEISLFNTGKVEEAEIDRFLDLVGKLPGQKNVGDMRFQPPDRNYRMRISGRIGQALQKHGLHFVHGDDVGAGVVHLAQYLTLPVAWISSPARIRLWASLAIDNTGLNHLPACPDCEVRQEPLIFRVQGNTLTVNPLTVNPTGGQAVRRCSRLRATLHKAVT